jgi:hypothetical protein
LYGKKGEEEEVSDSLPEVGGVFIKNNLNF